MKKVLIITTLIVLAFSCKKSDNKVPDKGTTYYFKVVAETIDGSPGDTTMYKKSTIN